MRQQLLLEAEQCRGQLIHSGDFRQSWLREADISEMGREPWVLGALASERASSSYICGAPGMEFGWGVP